MLSNDHPVIHLVDDDDAVRDSLKTLLESHGGTVLEYSSAPEFLQVLQDKPAGCLLLDLHLPIVSGLDLIEIMRERRIRLPVVLMTGRREEETRARAIRAGAVAFLEKPVREEVLIAAIRSALPATPESRSAEFSGSPEHQVLVPS